MAYPRGMELHGSGWRIKKRVPTDLKEYFSTKFLHYQTGEPDKKKAAVLIYRWQAEKEEEFLRIRTTGSALKKTITPDESAYLVASMLHSSLGAHEERRDFGDFAEDVAYEQFLQALEEDNAETQLAVSRGLYSGRLPEIVADWLRGYGYDIAPDSDAFRGLCKEFAKGRAQVIQAKKTRNSGEWVATPPMPSAPGTAPVGSSPMLSAVVKSFLSKQDEERPMYKKYVAALALFQEVLGDRPVNTLKQADIDGFFDLLCRLPPRWSDERRKLGVGVRELAAMKWPKVINGKTFKDSYKAAIAPFLAESRRLYGDQGFPAHLTAEGIKYSGDREGGEHKQRAMRQDELKRLFEGPEAVAFAGDPEQVHCYWLPLIGLYTGARVNEVCQLNPQHDIAAEEGIWFFHFTEETDGDSRITKSLKNKTSRRKVPIHSRLLELGLLAYVERIKKTGSPLLFPKWKPSKGKASGTAEKWFRKHLEVIGIRDETEGKRLVGFHAFRSTFLNRALNLGVSGAECLTGHAEEGKSSVVRGYEGEVELPKKKERIEGIFFELTFPAPL